MSRILITGAAGFIGFHLCRRLLAEGRQVVGVDSLNDYYDVSLKQARLAQLAQQPAFEFVELDLAQRKPTERCFASAEFPLVLHMAARAGVRYSLENPHAYIDSNIQGFLNVLEGCRRCDAEHLVYASSSSVYGETTHSPSSPSDRVDHPISLYAATKKANELMAHSYSHLYGIPATGLRFFTVYGPWGRPDMAIYKFTEAISRGRPIDVYNHGRMQRSFTYINDIVEGVVRIAAKLPGASTEGNASGGNAAAPYAIYNIGNDQSVELEYVIDLLEDALGCKARRNYLPKPPGDVTSTCADIETLRRAVGYSPSTPIEQGIREFVEWYREYQG